MGTQNPAGGNWRCEQWTPNGPCNWGVGARMEEKGPRTKHLARRGEHRSLSLREKGTTEPQGFGVHNGHGASGYTNKGKLGRQGRATEECRTHCMEEHAEPLATGRGVKACKSLQQGGESETGAAPGQGIWGALDTCCTAGLWEL